MDRTVARHPQLEVGVLRTWASTIRCSVTRLAALSLAYYFIRLRRRAVLLFYARVHWSSRFTLIIGLVGLFLLSAILLCAHAAGGDDEAWINDPAVVR
jgi:hypothetical protein